MPAMLALKRRLASLDSRFAIPGLVIERTDLPTNNPMVNHVIRLRLTDGSGAMLADLVEKSIKTIPGIVSREAWFHRHRGALDGSERLFHPHCYPSRRGLYETFLYTDFVAGRGARLTHSAVALVQGIGEIERRSRAYLAKGSPGVGALVGAVDFFRPWYGLRPRRRLGDVAARLEGDSGLGVRGIGRLVSALRRTTEDRRDSPACFCHLDYTHKNVIALPKGLALIDWSEFQIGRIGFDVGAFLGTRFTRLTLPAFCALQSAVAEADISNAADETELHVRAANRDWIFLVYALYGCSRSAVLDAPRSAESVAVLRGKLDFLLKMGAHFLVR